MDVDGGERKAGLIMVKHMKNDGSSFVFAWFSGVGACQILNRGSTVPQKDALVVGQWYSFRLAVHYKRNNELVAFADQAVPIKTAWAASATRVNADGRQAAQVHKVLMLVGAVQKAADVAVAWSPFFQRVAFEHLKDFKQDQVKTGAVLSLTIAHKLIDGDCCWAAISIDEQLATTGLEMQQMSVKKLIAEFASFDASKELCWATGENGEKICFGACDFDRQQQQTSAVEFQPGDRFLAWIGERSPMVAYHRAFYVQLLSSVPMYLTGKAPQHQQQQQDTTEARLPLVISPSSISDLPSILIATSPPVSDHSSPGKETGRKPLNEQWTQTDEAQDEWQKAAVSREQCLRDGRQLYGRIIRQPDIFSAVCQHDPSILSDLFTLFNP